MFETPIHFNIEIKNKLFSLLYTDLMEVGQGGPEVGHITINSKPLGKYYFGGPILSNDRYIYIPVYIKKCLGYGFKIAEISINELEIRYLGSFKNLIYLDKIEGGTIVFYEDIHKEKRNETII